MSQELKQLQIRSSAFEQKASIPKQYTHEGDDLSPPLTIEGAPLRVLSFAIIVDDPDAPLGDFVHWVAWNLDPDLSFLPEGGAVPNEGINDFGIKGYRGPFPPKGRPHRYFFKVFALDKRLNLPENTRKADLLKAMEGHILAKGELIGIYER